jgi:DNA-binding XRE family transcriptional regulator
MRFEIGERVLLDVEVLSSPFKHGDSYAIAVQIPSTPQAIVAPIDSLRLRINNVKHTEVDLDETRPVVAKRIRERRHQLNLAQWDLAKQVGVSQNAVSNWERGECLPHLRTVPRLCAALRLEADELWPSQG